MKRLLPSLMLLASCGGTVVAQQAAPTTSSSTTTTTTTTTTIAPTTTTAAPTTTTLPPAPVGSLCPSWYNTAQAAGWTDQEWERLDYIIWRESRCNPDSHNTLDPSGGSYGGVQINGFWCRKHTSWLRLEQVLNDCTDLFDPVINMRAALAIWNRSGWTAWGF